MKLVFFISLFVAMPLWACDTQAKDPSRIAVAGGSITEILYF